MGHHVAKKSVLKLIAIYQCWSHTQCPCCRFWPSCSVYGYQVIEHFGLLKGIYLLIKRIIRCHPWGGYGLDLPPHHVHEES